MTSPNNDDQKGEGGAASAAKADPCPICKKPGVKTYEPFCSKRCADVDLHRWFSGGYSIPATEEDDSSGEG